MDEKRLYKTIGANIRQLRTQNNHNQSQLAKKIGLERTSVTNIETGRQKVTVFVLYKICEVFQIELEKLLPSPVELLEHKIDSDNKSNVVVGEKTLAAIKNIRSN